MPPASIDIIKPSRVDEVAASVGISLDGDAARRLSDFGRLFLTWNDRINLGGAISGDELVARHFLDSFAASRFVAAASRVVDAGSGGGLPALPLAVVRPDLTFRLFEPTGKKVAFLRTAIRELGLKDRVDVHAERVVAGALAEGRLADVATSRATWDPSEWLELGRTLVRPGGGVVVFGTGGSTDPKEAADDEWSYAPHRRVLLYRRPG